MFTPLLDSYYIYIHTHRLSLTHTFSHTHTHLHSHTHTHLHSHTLTLTHIHAFAGARRPVDIRRSEVHQQHSEGVRRVRIDRNVLSNECDIYERRADELAVLSGNCRCTVLHCRLLLRVPSESQYQYTEDYRRHVNSIDSYC